MGKLGEIFQEADGSFSFVRVILFLVVVAVIGKNIFVTVHTGNNVALDFNEVMVIAAALGAKVAQKPFEKPTPTPPPVS